MLYQWQEALDLKNSKNYANSVVVSDMASLRKGFQLKEPRGACLDFTSSFNYWKSTNNIKLNYLIKLNFPTNLTLCFAVFSKQYNSNFGVALKTTYNFVDVAGKQIFIILQPVIYYCCCPTSKNL